MKIRLVSDIHLEFKEKFRLIEHEDDAEAVLVLAGDIGVLDKTQNHSYDLEKFLKAVQKRFRKVIYVPGNHEFYGVNSNIIDAMATLRIICDDTGTILLTNSVHEDVEGVVFYGGIGWTDLCKKNPVVVTTIKNDLNDFSMIRKSTEDNSFITEDDWVRWNMDYALGLARARRIYHDSFLVAISHHSPYIGFRNRENILDIDYAYHQSTPAMLEMVKPNMWLHGHTHDRYMNIYDTADGGSVIVATNAVGYENKIDEPMMLDVELGDL